MEQELILMEKQARDKFMILDLEGEEKIRELKSNLRKK